MMPIGRQSYIDFRLDPQRLAKSIETVRRYYTALYGDALQYVGDVASYILPIDHWVENFIKPYVVMNPRVSRQMATHMVTELLDSVHSVFTRRNFFTESIFFRDLDARRFFNRSWWINVYGEAGTGKSLWGLVFYLRFDDDSLFWDILLKRQVTSSSTEMQQNIAYYSKLHDVYETIWRLTKTQEKVDLNTIFQAYKRWLESNPKLSFSRGATTVYYDGMRLSELRQLFIEAIQYWKFLGYIEETEADQYILAGKYRFPRKVFIIDETLRKFGRGSIITQESFANMIKVSRTKQINVVFCGITRHNLVPYTYILRAENGLYDARDPEKLKVLRAGVHYLVRYGGSYGSGYDRVGTAVTLSPPDEIIKRYLEEERFTTASAEIGGLGLTDFARANIMRRFDMLNSIDNFVDPEDVVDELERTSEYKELAQRGKITWNRLKPIVERIVEEKYQTMLTSSLWDRIRLVIEARGLKD